MDTSKRISESKTDLRSRIFLVLCIFLLNGCALIKARPAPDSGFLPHGDMLKPINERSPFHGVWYADPLRLDEMKKDYHYLYVMPVDTKYLESQIRAQQASEMWKSERIEDLHEIARYMEQRLKNSLREYPNHPMQIVDEVCQKTFVFESAIVELNPTSPTVNTLGTIAGFFVPGGGLIKFAGTGSIAMEGILRDGETGESLVEIRDRETDKTSPISIKDYQQYAHDREAVDDWSKTLAELAATPYEHRVEGPLPFTLNPF